MTKILNIYEKNKQIILYIYFGGLTTVVSLLSYVLFLWAFSMPAWLATFISSTLAIIFAFFTNRTFVFNSKVEGFLAIFREFVSFVFARVLFMAINVLAIFILVDILSLHEIIMFIIMQVVITILNYIASKFFIFKEKNDV